MGLFVTLNIELDLAKKTGISMEKNKVLRAYDQIIYSLFIQNSQMERHGKVNVYGRE